MQQQKLQQAVLFTLQCSSCCPLDMKFGPLLIIWGILFYNTSDLSSSQLSSLVSPPCLIMSSMELLKPPLTSSQVSLVRFSLVIILITSAELGIWAFAVLQYSTKKLIPGHTHSILTAELIFFNCKFLVYDSSL